ncbi:MAG: YggS family pyridoxal phosphate-dependent enzyme [Flavobacteriales bacterium]|nr:YggS family pyridoxal phosphate-dependent enzyme [Flavobacteriales bacterium]
MSTIQHNLEYIKAQLPNGVTLVAVSKTKPVELIQEAYDAGQRIFGENRVQEMCDKHALLPADIQWHMIGHLQTNKVKYMASFVTMVHGIDSLKLLAEVDKQASKCDRKIDCLLQFHIATEETKFGLDLEEARELLNSEAYLQMHNVRIRGVMGMATFTDKVDQVKHEFKSLRTIFETLRDEFFEDRPDFDTLSMGMSGDYLLAVEEGSTLVRIGSSIFGSRL